MYLTAQLERAIMLTINKLKELKRLMLVVVVLLSCNVICLSVLETLGGETFFSEVPADMETEKGEKEKEKEEDTESERDKFYHNSCSTSNYLLSGTLSHIEAAKHLTSFYLEVTSPLLSRVN